MTLRFATGLAFMSLTALGPLRADVLLSHAFGGDGIDPLNEVAPDTNLIRPVPWNAGPVIAANGQVNDGTNSDQGAVFDLGISWKFKPQSNYKVTLGFSQLDNAILFAGFRTANPSGEAQVQTQGTSFAMRIREISGSDNVGIFQWPGGIFTEAAEFSYDANTSSSFTLEIQTNDLTDASVTVGTAQVTVDLSADPFRYFFVGFEDPLVASPASDAKFDTVVLEGPLPDPLPQLEVTRIDGEEVTISWPTETGEWYAVQGSGDMVTWSYVDESDVNPFPGTGEPEVFVDTRTEGTYFYRLVRP